MRLDARRGDWEEQRYEDGWAVSAVVSFASSPRMLSMEDVALLIGSGMDWRRSGVKRLEVEVNKLG
jgi:hypothetical protein